MRSAFGVIKNPATEEGILLKVMARGPFEQGHQVWIIDRDGSKVGTLGLKTFLRRET